MKAMGSKPPGKIEPLMEPKDSRRKKLRKYFRTNMMNFR